MLLRAEVEFCMEGRVLKIASRSMYLLGIRQKSWVCNILCTD